MQGVVSYEYDNLNRLTSERIGVNGPETNWTYNAGGNITRKSVNGGQQIYYGYQGNWPDQLTDYDREAITYDACGNPVDYRGAAMTWTRGRMLETYSGGNGLYCNYAYNAEGYRVRKTIGGGGLEHKYWLEGSRILKETRVGYGLVNDTLLYYYDAGGVCGFNYNGTDYYYRKNLQGDVTHIHDVTGTLVGSYTYDAWGCCTIGTNIGNIAETNPFRYRGYYYDSEIQMYYLNSRYYDPEVGRFINADSVSYVAPKTINGLNLYAYCGNNPINNIDENGKNWKKIFTKIALIAAAVAIAVVGVGLICTGVGIAVIVGVACVSAATSAVINGFANEAAGGDFVSGYTGGFVGGFVSGLIPVPVFNNALGCVAATAITSYLDKSLGLNNKTDREIWDEAVDSAVKSIPISFFSVLTGADQFFNFGVDMNTIVDLEELPFVRKILDWFSNLFGGNSGKYSKVY